MSKVLLFRISIYFIAGAYTLFFVLLIHYGRWRTERYFAPADPEKIRATENWDVTKPLRFFVFGDSGTGDRFQFAVALAMEERCKTYKPDAILLLGDNIYMTGADSLTDPEWVEKVVRPYSQDCLNHIPMYPVLGNHDYQDKPSMQIAFNQIWPRWQMAHRFYRRDYSRMLRLISFDTIKSDVCFDANKCAMNFLWESLENHEKFDWTIMYGHHPLASAAKRGHSHSGETRGIFMKPFVCQKVDIYLAGHSHHLEVRKPSECQGTWFIQSGGGGAELHKVIEGQKDVSFVASKHGYLEMLITPQTIDLTFFDPENNILYQDQKTQ